MKNDLQKCSVYEEYQIFKYKQLIFELKEENRKLSGKIKSLDIRRQKELQNYERSNFKSYLRESYFYLDLQIYLQQIMRKNSNEILQYRDKIQCLKKEIKRNGL